MAKRENKLSRQIIGLAIEVHKQLGPDLLESAYETCLCRELSMKDIPFERQKSLPIDYKGTKLDCGYKLDVVVAELVVVELKAIEKIAPIHTPSSTSTISQTVKPETRSTNKLSGHPFKRRNYTCG